MPIEWKRFGRVDPAEFDENNGTGLVRAVAPFERIVQDPETGYCYDEWAMVIPEPLEFPIPPLLSKDLSVWGHQQWDWELADKP